MQDCPQLRAAPELVCHEHPVQSRNHGCLSWDLAGHWSRGWVCAAVCGGLQSVVTPAVMGVVSLTGGECPSCGNLQPLQPGPTLGARAELGSLVLRPEPLPQADFFPAAFFSALKPPFLRATSFTEAMHEGFGLPAMSCKCWCWCHARGSLGWWEQPGGTHQCGAPAATLPIIPKPAGAPPRGECSIKGGLKLSNGETSDRGALEALLFQRVGVRDPLRHERLRSSVPKVTARRRRTGGVWLHREVIPGTAGTGIPAPSLPSQRVN